MRLKPWSELPHEFQNEAVRPYYDYLSERRISLTVKRIFDVMVSLGLLLLLSPIFLILSIAISLDSPGGVFFRQVRVTTYGKEFRIFKFRTMVSNAEALGTQVTTSGDMRITRIGKLLRGCRLDELPQLINILVGDMTLVGTRPEVPKYVDCYTPEMWATLLLPAGVTSEASILYKDEGIILEQAKNIDTVYVTEVLPQKMEYNLRALKNFSFWGDVVIMLRTVEAVFMD